MSMIARVLAVLGLGLICYTNMGDVIPPVTAGCKTQTMTRFAAFQKGMAAITSVSGSRVCDCNADM